MPNGTDQIGPVSSADRGGLTGLQQRSTTGVLPAGTRGVEVMLRFTRIEGSFNDGYADSIALLIKHTGGPTLSVTTLTAGSTATLTIAHGSANGLVQIGYSLAGGGRLPPRSAPFCCLSPSSF
ncbi:MAG: hypothetical protein HQ519_10590 [Planctomycetes bacterium]|nr:hypothetical protein [Planctomycetota bacterium]